MESRGRKVAFHGVPLRGRIEAMPISYKTLGKQIDPSTEFPSVAALKPFWWMLRAVGRAGVGRLVVSAGGLVGQSAAVGSGSAEWA